jgi:hypothetical protein
LNPQSPKSAAFTLEPIPDLVPSNAFLFDDLKEKLGGKSFTRSDDYKLNQESVLGHEEGW